MLSFNAYQEDSRPATPEEVDRLFEQFCLSQELLWDPVANNYSKKLRGTSVYNYVYRTLSQDRRVTKLLTLWQNIGNLRGPHELSNLALWTTYSLHLNGREKTESILENYLNSETVEVHVTIWCGGLTVPKSVKLENGCQIVSVEDFMWTPHTYLHRYSNNRHPASCVITKACTILKSSEESDPWSGIDQISEVSKEVQAVSSILNLCGLLCVPIMQSTYLHPDTPTGFFGGSGFSSNSDHFFSASSVYVLESSKTAKIEKWLSVYTSKSSEEQGRIDRMIKRVMDSKRTSSYEDKILDLGIALEMLLLSDLPNDQLSQTLRIRGSKILNTDLVTTKDNYTTIGKIYTYRSKVAHSGEIKKMGKKDKLTIEYLYDHLTEYYQLVEDIFYAVLSKDSIDWKDIMLG